MSARKEWSPLWNNIIQTYDKAQESGAAAKYKTSVQTLTDHHLSLKFVLRVSDSLRDKPKPPNSRCAQLPA